MNALPLVSRGWWAVAGPCPWSECAFAWGLGGLCSSDAAPASCTEDFWFSLLTLDIPPSPFPLLVLRGAHREN